MDALFKELKIYASQGQLYEPVDHSLILSYKESQSGQILEQGITEAGSTASWIAAGTSYATRGVPMVPFYTYYSMFGFQRVGDLLWAASDSRARGFLLGATSGRTTLLGEGLQHQDGHSHVLASVIPACEAYDPAFAYEIATIIEHGLKRMYVDNEDVYYYLTLYNENYVQPPKPEGSDQGIIDGLYKWAAAPIGDEVPRHDPVLRSVACGRSRGADDPRRGVRRRSRTVERNVVQAVARGSDVGRPVELSPPGRGPQGAVREHANSKARSDR